MLSLVVIRAQNINRLASFYSALGLKFTKHRHGNGPEHLSSTIGETVFEIYPSKGGNETTIATRLGFSVPSLTNALVTYCLTALGPAGGPNSAFPTGALMRRIAT